jgi:hypothetical protein
LLIAYGPASTCPLHRVGVGHVQRQDERAVSAESRRGALRLVAIDVGECHKGAALMQPARRLQPDSPRSAGHERDLAGNVVPCHRAGS